MSTVQRIQKIDSLIRLGRMKSAGKLAEELEVSRRTIERDLETLRLELNADVVYNREKGCYQYTGNPLPLPGQWLNERDMAILLIAERALRQFTGASFQSEIHPVFNKMLNPIRGDKKAMNYIKDLCKSVHFHRPFTPITDVKHTYSIALDSIMERRRLRMIYESATHANVKNDWREVEPYVLVNNGGDWYLVGLCKQSTEVRTFALSRILEIEQSEHCFIMPDKFDIEEYLHSGFGRMTGKKISKVRLLISPPASAWIATSKWHDSQKIKKLKNGQILLSMTCPVTDSLLRWILQMGKDVCVESPKELRDRVRETAGEMVKSNKG